MKFPTSFGPQYKDIWATRVMRLPDTTGHRPQLGVPGAIGRNTAGTKIFVWDGTQWVAGSGGVTIDSTFITSIDSIFINTHDSIFIVSGNDTIYIGQDNSSVDSIFISNTDSIYQIINGDTIFIGTGNGIRDTAYLTAGYGLIIDSDDSLYKPNGGNRVMIVDTAALLSYIVFNINNDTTINQIDSGQITYFVDSIVNAPPPGAVNGNIWLIGTSPTGLFAGKTGQIAELVGAVYSYTIPNSGDIVAVTNPLTAFYKYNGTTWVFLRRVPSIGGDDLGVVEDLGNLSAKALSLLTNGRRRFTITSGGKIRIQDFRGVDTSNNYLYVSDSTNGEISTKAFRELVAGTNITITSSATKDTISSTASGSTNLNIGSGYRLAVPGSNNIKTIHAGTNITMDSVSNANEITITAASGSGLDTTKQFQAYLYGTLLNQTNFTDTSGYSSHGTTPAITATKLVFTGGSGTFTKTFDYSYVTDLEKYTISMRQLVGTKGGTTYGLGVGTRSSSVYTQYSCDARVDASSGGTAGSLYIDVNGTNVATAATTITFSAGDYVFVRLERTYDTLTATAWNMTTKSIPVTVKYGYPLAYSAAQIMPNVGKFCIYNLGGTQTVDSINITSAEIKNADIMGAGDSKWVGYYAGTKSGRVADILDKNFRLIVNAGGSEGTQDLISRISGEIAGLAPKSVLLNIGRNDIAQGMSASTIYANYDTIVARIRRLGIKVYHLLPLYETVVDQSGLTAHIVSTFSADSIIDSRLYDNSGTAANILAADNIHPNALGDSIIARSILASGKFNKYIPIVWGSNAAATNYTFSTGLLNTANTITAKLSTGVSGGQSVIGGTGSGDNLTLSSTTNGTKGKLIFGTSAYDEVNNRLGLLTTSPTLPFELSLNTTVSDQMYVHNSSTGGVRTAIAFYNSTAFPAIFGINSTGFGGYGASTAGNIVIYGGTDFCFMADNSGIMKWATGGNTEKMRLDASGRLSVGRTSTTHKLDVLGDALFAGNVASSFDAGSGSTLTALLSMFNSDASSYKSGLSWGSADNTHTFTWGTDSAGNKTNDAYLYSARLSRAIARFDSVGHMSLGIVETNSETSPAILMRNATTNNVEQRKISIGQTTLVTGTKAVNITGLTTGSIAFVTLVSPSGASSTIQYQAVCTSNTLTIQANVAAGTINTADGSTLNYQVYF